MIEAGCGHQMINCVSDQSQPKCHHRIPFIINPVNYFDRSFHYQWKSRPKSCLLVEKIYDTSARDSLIDAIQFINQEIKIQIYLEEYVHDELPEYAEIKIFKGLSETTVDFVLVFGGDGTLLHVSQLFPKTCPPIVPFAQGSLGFLTNFPTSICHQVINELVTGCFYVTSRTRMVCEISRDGEVVNRYHVLNDVVIKHSLPTSLCVIDCSIDDVLFTTIYGDGMIVSTSTGSTSYNMSANGPMVHPSTSSLVWTPICPHSLNAHPLILPDGVCLSFSIADNSRGDSPYFVCYDSDLTEIKKGDKVSVYISSYPLHTVCSEGPIIDWLNRISSVLRWNQPMETSDIV